MGSGADQPDLPRSRRLEVEHAQARRQGDGGRRPLKSGEPGSATFVGDARGRTHAGRTAGGRAVPSNVPSRCGCRRRCRRHRRDASRSSRSAGSASPAEPLSALAPENLSKPRPKAPFDLTGNWFVDTSRPRRAGVSAAVSEADREGAEGIRHRHEAAQGRQGLQGRHRPVLAGRPAAHHDALLADGDDSAANGGSTWSASS